MRDSLRGRSRAAGIAVAAVVILTPAPAWAVDRFVDAETGVDAEASCAQANPCDTIAYALANSLAGDEIFVDNGSYPESVTLAEGRSLSYDNFVAADGGGAAIVDGGADTAIVVDASGAGRIENLTIRSNAQATVALDGAALVVANTFDDLDAPGFINYVVAAAHGSTIRDNEFIDPEPGPDRGRAGVLTNLHQMTVVGNSFTGLMTGVMVGDPGDGRTTVVEGNVFTGTHNQPVQGKAIAASASGGHIVIRENEISAPTTPGVYGVMVDWGDVSLVRNDISGHQAGVRINADTTNVTMEGDRIWGSEGFGVDVFDVASGPQTSLSATNVTVWGNASADIFLDKSALSLDSSILETAIGWTPGSTCAIAHSRAESIGMDPSGCDSFQTIADPMFADPLAGDFHLLAGSPMIDAGDPAAPAPGATDFDGDPRAIDATPACEGDDGRRDIGADEFVPAAVNCPPEPPVGDPPASDTRSPRTTFIRRPSKKTKRKRVEFVFAADEAASFRCQLDSKPAFACPGSARFKVKPGRHVFQVTATDLAGNVESAPARYSFRRTRPG